MSTALYRRYRPETFTDVIGQEHVTEPLMAALVADRITHAYLFSGPRGCGKTTSARILARCLNCAEGPTATPCGTCDSCTDLARGGPGSLDVVEIDAASHNGVDDARELRERAAFAPARDRFKIFILDEAHMVTTQGFNALLKLVEEPPSHVKFVFATTEPDKVIGTIRSRTHHYPFRLVPPEQLLAYLEHLAQAEGTSVDNGVLPLVVRAGGGSVRDSLSVLDQLIAGADGGQVTYERAVALLGFTHGALLDDAVESLAARDGASLFRVVDRVIDSGHAPRRFVEDLLERLRDLIVVRAAGESAGAVLRTVPADQLERMHNQAQHLGAGALSRAADLVNEGLTEMTGATSPRLQLELLCARLLLPAADDGVEGFHARLDRLEGALAAGGAVAPNQGFPPAVTPGQPQADDGVGQQPPAPSTAVPPARPAGGSGAAAAAQRSEPNASGQRPGAVSSAAPSSAVPSSAVPPAGADDRHTSAGASAGEPHVGRTSAAEATPTPSSARPTTMAPPAEGGPGPRSGTEGAPVEGAAAASAPAGAPEPVSVPGGRPPAGGAPGPSAPAAPVLTSDEVRRRWPEVLETLAQLKRTTWALISQDAQVVDLSATTLSIGFSTSGLATAFRNGPHGDVLSQALRETLGLEVKVEPVLSADQPVGSGPSAPSAPSAPGPSAAASATVPAPDLPSQMPSGNRPAPPDHSGLGAPGGRAVETGDDIQASGADSAPGSGRDTAPPAAGHDRGSAPSGGSTSADATADASGGWADVAVRRPPQPAEAEPEATRDDPGRAAGSGEAAPSSTTAASSPGRTAPQHEQSPPWDEDVPPAEPPEDPYSSRPAPSVSEGPRSAAASGRPGSSNAVQDAPARSGPRPWERDAPAQAPPPVSADEEDHPDPDDPDLDTTDVVGAPLVARLLGGTVIDEIVEDEGENR